MTLTIKVKGTPRPQGSKRVFNRFGRMMLVEASKHLPAWRRAVKKAAMQAMKNANLDLNNWPLFNRKNYCTVIYVFFIKRFGTDIDKLIRAVNDACTDAKVWMDDSQIQDISARKIKVATIYEEGVALRIIPHGKSYDELIAEGDLSGYAVRQRLVGEKAEAVIPERKILRLEDVFDDVEDGIAKAVKQLDDI